MGPVARGAQGAPGRGGRQRGHQPAGSRGARRGRGGRWKSRGAGEALASCWEAPAGGGAGGGGGGGGGAGGQRRRGGVGRREKWLYFSYTFEGERVSHDENLYARGDRVSVICEAFTA